MKKCKLPIIVLATLLLISALLNMFQWLRSRNVSAAPAIITIWSDGEEVFESDALFQAYKETV